VCADVPLSDSCGEDLEVDLEVELELVVEDEGACVE
jgi:hypothetical protein